MDHHIAILSPTHDRQVAHDRDRGVTIIGNKFRFHYRHCSGPDGTDERDVTGRLLRVSASYSILHQTRSLDKTNTSVVA